MYIIYIHVIFSLLKHRVGHKKQIEAPKIYKITVQVVVVMYLCGEHHYCSEFSILLKHCSIFVQSVT